MRYPFGTIGRVVATLLTIFFALVGLAFGVLYVSAESSPSGPALPIVVVISVAALAIAALFGFVAVVGRPPGWVHPIRGRDPGAPSA